VFWGFEKEERVVVVVFGFFNQMMELEMVKVVGNLHKMK